MLIYTDVEVQEIVSRILECEIEIKPIGHHELKRNLVYLVTNQYNEKSVFKLYYKKNRWNREVGALKLLADSEVKAPALLDYGVLSDGTEWILMEYISGQPFAEMMKEIPFEEQRKIVYQMGEEMGKFHTVRKSDTFGGLDENSQPISQGDYLTRFKRGVDANMKEILVQNLAEETLLQKGYDILHNLISCLKSVKVAHFCNSDFGPRNLLVRKEGDNWNVAGLIDFEHTGFSDPDADLVDLYYTLFWEYPEFEEDFFSGYCNYRKVGKELEHKKVIYILNSGLGICSWSKIQAPDYYQTGIKLVKWALEHLDEGIQR